MKFAVWIDQPDDPQTYEAERADIAGSGALVLEDAAGPAVAFAAGKWIALIRYKGDDTSPDPFTAATRESAS